MTGISARRHRRFGRRDDAKEDLKEAQEKGDQEAVERFSKRTVKVTKQHTDDCKKLLTLMGVPYVEVRMASQKRPDLLQLWPCGCIRLSVAPVIRQLLNCKGWFRDHVHQTEVYHHQHLPGQAWCCCHLHGLSARRLRQRQRHSAALCARPIWSMVWPQMTWMR
jgi:hypothetical protein